MEDDFIGDIAKANLDAFLVDLAGPAQAESAKNLADFRKSQDTNRDIDSFLESLDIPGPAGRSHAAPRLRTEHQESEPEMTWRPGDDPSRGLDPPETSLEKNSGQRKKAMLRGWFSSQLAVGKSAADLIQHAERHDLQTANLLRDLAAEID